jgi:hypothetical protein
MKTAIRLCIIVLFGAAASGCAWVGDKAGHAYGKMEQGAHEMKQGYQQGYKSEQGKSPSSGTAAESGKAPQTQDDNGGN